ncbi:MAG: hypothetical protein GYA56_10090 [Geobacteraceae bacterium]|jgi:hypothetical protein|nr:hypothetical protein [Geobacteraceae bacterium]
MLLRITLVLSVIALMVGCETMRNNKISWQLEESAKNYNLLMRWDELDKAVLLYPPDSLREEFRRKAQNAKGVKVTDVRVKSQVCSPAKGEATVVVEIEYFREPSVTVRTVEYVQNWRYVEEGKDNRTWRLMTLPPDFR